MTGTCRSAPFAAGMVMHSFNKATGDRELIAPFDAVEIVQLCAGRRAVELQPRNTSMTKKPTA
jgi:hypothetical protein